MPSRDRAWWGRVVRIPWRPAPAFEAVEDTSRADEQARTEPLLAIIVLAGIGGTLMTSFAGRVLDEQQLDAVEVALWGFIGGSFYGFAFYWLLGLVAFAGGAAAGSSWTYKQARHILAFASVPIALSLVIWPPRLALYGLDTFRAGGSDEGAGGTFFEALELAFLAWACALLVYGISVAHAWPLRRGLAAAALPLLAPLLALLRAYDVV